MPGSGCALLRGGLGESQQLTECRCSGPMHAGAEGHFHRLQIHVPCLSALSEDAAQQCGYFARNFPYGSPRLFFPCAVSASSSGRRAQIFSLTSTISPQSF